MTEDPRPSEDRLREAAARLVDTSDDLARWDEANGYVVNSERDALAGQVADAWGDLRAALATPSSVTPDLRAALEAARRVKADAIENGGRLTPGAILDTQTVIDALVSVTPSEPTLTHGRHCPCSACAREDWTNPDLAHCGMHGPSCPAIYAPVGPA